MAGKMTDFTERPPKSRLGTEAATHSDVVRHLIEYRTQLFAFIFAAVRDYHAAEEVMQNVAVIVCDKAHQYQPGTSFRAWAREIARRQVLQYVRQSNRGPFAVAPADLDHLAAAFEEVDQAGLMEDRVQALRVCMERASSEIRKMFQFRYEERLTLDQIAERLSLKSDSVRKALYRARIALRKCIDKRLRSTSQSHG